MTSPRDIRFDVASAISQGKRPYQEDALVTDFPLGSDIGFAVLADGMGGHAAGDVASKIVVTEVFSELKLQSGNPETFRAHLPEILRQAALAANECVRVHIESHTETAGMGATLIAPVILGRSLFWISVGDSPLLLWRDGILTQLNENHSMAPQIDFMVESGMMSEDVGRNHPDRSCLTSVLGGEYVPRIDCPPEPLLLKDGDVIIAASDGIEYLHLLEMSEFLHEFADRPSGTIADELLARLEAHDDPEQDNASFTVIKVAIPVPVAQAEAHAANGHVNGNGHAADLKVATGRRKSGFFSMGASLFRGSAQ